ncbi:MAG TPA: UDP-N-acetylmuramoyl-L-alanine--D-glutamate ligase [Patescibacteria group bacterium]|nr:UDP-N-acetylmuramoyl-L-alanine--D-glutamate ligase [Patescibacteria group bacterium]
MELASLQGKLVAVLGYGQEGRAVAAYLLSHGIRPVLFDQKPWEEWDIKERAAIKQLKLNFIFGPSAFRELAGFEVAFRSPGINPDHPDLQPVLKRGAKLTSQTEWFFEHCPGQIIGVTGTKGKGTTSSLICKILQQAGQRAYLTGNIGKIQPLELLDGLRSDDRIVYELSSFQLMGLQRSPHIAVVLMTTSEHLNYHASEAEYVRAKSAITRFQTAADFAVINADYPNSAAIGRQGGGQKYFFSRRKKVIAGCYAADGQLIYIEPGQTELAVLPLKDLKLRGEHNWENVAAAAAAAHLAGAAWPDISHASLNFAGLEHRLEFAEKRGGISFYNDSFSTTPETAIAAITAFREPEIVILGGSSKHSDFAELGRTILARPNIRALVLIGTEAARLRQAVSAAGKFAGPILTGAKSMAEIFKQLRGIAQAGDVVLLSPACASFDMFQNYRDRGEQFKQQAALW